MKRHAGAKLLLLTLPAACLAQTPRPATPAPAQTSPAPADRTIKLESLPGAKTSTPAPAAAPDPNKVIVTVGEEKITQGEFDALLSALPEQVRANASRPEGRRQIADQLVNVKMLAQAARKEKLDQEPQVRQQLAFQRDNILAGAYYQQMAKNLKIDEAATQKYYNDHKTDYDQVQARHVLIRFQGSPVPLKPTAKELTKPEALAKAQEVRKRLVAGEDFAKVAQEVSDDTGSGASGGDLGSFRHGQMVPQFEQVAFQLPIGQVSEPVETQFGYHLIKVEKRESKQFADVRGEIEQRLRPEMSRQALDSLKKQTTVTLDEAYFGPTPPVTPPPIPAPAATPGK